MIKESTEFNFYSVEKQDLSLLYNWFQKQHIIEWWPVPKKEKDFFEHFLKRIHSKDTFPFMVYADKIPIGYIQYYLLDTQKDSWLPLLPNDTIGIDQLIGEIDYIGKGYGQKFIKDFIEYIKKEKPALQTIIVDPDPKNIRAIKCYEKVGFKFIGEYQAHWGPAYLMKYEFN